jgi:hypothetical protein
MITMDAHNESTINIVQCANSGAYIHLILAFQVNQYFSLYRQRKKGIHLLLTNKHSQLQRLQ